MLMLLNLFSFKTKIFFNALKCALFTRKNVVCFVNCLTGERVRLGSLSSRRLIESGLSTSVYLRLERDFLEKFS